MKRLAVEMVAPNDTQLPAVIDELSLERIATLLQTSPTIAVVDLGVHATPTSHPSFLRFAQLIGGTLRERGGYIVVWCDTTTDRDVLAKLAQSTCPIVTIALPTADDDEVNSLNRSAGLLTGDDISPDDRYALGVPLAARPDAPYPIVTESIRGGCPIVEQRLWFFGTDGREFACQRRMQRQDALRSQMQDGSAYKTATEQWHELRHELRLDHREQAGASCAGCKFSYQGWVDDDRLRTFWIQQDDRGDVVNPLEREYLFGEAIPTAQRVTKVDLGCGPIKRRGFVGIDRFALPGVDITADINTGIPLPEDSVDYLVASHSLEHFDDLPNVIHEIHRICKDRALVTIVAPYSATGLNLANPYHVQVFNEHTARFFTNGSETALQPADYDFPSAENWGLASSDHSNWRADLRLLKCEFFYMPAYRGLNESAKRVLRQSLNDVCEQMLLQLLVVKSPISEAEFSERARSTVYQEPPAVTARRKEEAISGQANIFTELTELPQSVYSLSEAVTRWSSQFNERLSVIERDVAERRQTSDADRTNVAKRVTAVNSELIRRDLAQQNRLAELEAAVARLQPHSAEQFGTTPHATAASAEGKLSPARANDAGAASPSGQQTQAVREILSRERDGKNLTRLIRRYRRRAQDLTSLIAPNFESLKQYGDRQGWIARGLRLQESDLWHNGQEWIYDLPVETGSVVGIRLAITTQFKPTAPIPLFDCTVWSATTGTQLTGVKVAPYKDLAAEPMQLSFAPIDVTRGSISVRLVGLPAVETLGVRTIEWRGLTALRQVRSMYLFCEPVYK
ncbi:class I SAM-dependent methyltransferase [Paraburkholderia bryophila]|uniref:SAM-dependent methyltransferase n=1 Tax=Paraburkholderia bryophila TaxID=420952 RepID=A0A7Y9WJZ2_9BURK|nr:class I SAM-dependent methyltransferase [Paraburkholderia bryophila]NYH22315.1 SAM-dependent methyltransferase [Paraburkholderia bryophila]